MAFSLNGRWLRERALSLVSRPHPAPVFVFGNQKAGTSAIAALLSAATGQTLIADFAGAREPHIGRLLRSEVSVPDFVVRNAWAFSAPIVKEPGLTFVAPMLLDFFPGERSVFVMRDPRANIRSILGRLELRGDTDVPERTGTRRINPVWRDILSGRDLGLAPDHFVTVLARRWVRAAQICESLGARAIVVRYEDFVRAKKKVIHDIAARLDLAVRKDISTMVDHPFQPSGTSPATTREFFGPNLSRIDEVCGETASRFGYFPERLQTT